MNAEEAFEALLVLYRNYSNVYRRNIALDKYDSLMAIDYDITQLKAGSDVWRESLLEHIGNLPMIAVFLYPYLEHKSGIDLGNVLKMLAVHDIGETVVGDGHPHQKTDEFIDLEYQAALQLLPSEYHSVLDEYEARQTLDAKFAKSVDVFSTFLADQLLPQELVQERLVTHQFSWQEIEEKRYGVFAWDIFLKALFEVVIKRYRQIGV